MVRNVFDHPVCASKVASQLFLIALPPLLWRRGLSSSPTDIPLGATRTATIACSVATVCFGVDSGSGGWTSRTYSRNRETFATCLNVQIVIPFATFGNGPPQRVDDQYHTDEQQNREANEYRDQVITHMNFHTSSSGLAPRSGRIAVPTL